MIKLNVISLALSLLMFYGHVTLKEEDAKPIDCYQLKSLNTRRMNGNNCSQIIEFQRVKCLPIQGCFGFLDSNYTLNFGCGDTEKCKIYKNCCFTNFCNCEDKTNGTALKN